MRESRESLLAELAEVGVEQFTAPDYRPGRVTHIVLLRFEPSVSPGAVDEVRTRFLDLGTSDRIESIAGGEQLSGEPDNQFDAGFVLTFSSLGDRNYYVGAPIVTDPAYFDAKHAEFKRFLGRLVSAVEVVDFFG